jgi:hypothetical protein
VLLGKRLALLSRNRAAVLQAEQSTPSGTGQGQSGAQVQVSIHCVERRKHAAGQTLAVRSLLLPMSIIVMLGLACCRASSNQLARWLKVSRLRHTRHL